MSGPLVQPKEILQRLFSIDDSEVGVLIEVRRSTEYASAVSEQVVDSTDCPRCGYVQPAGADECDRCGLVFAKFEREQVSGMQTSRQLEDALTRALQSREEWAQKAKAYLETHPLKEGSTDGFDNLVMRDEVSFLRLVSDEGPILMTSRRFIASSGRHCPVMVRPMRRDRTRTTPGPTGRSGPRRCTRRSSVPRRRVGR